MSAKEQNNNIELVNGKSFDFSKPKQQEAAIKEAEKLVTEAKVYYNQTRRYLRRCNNLLKELKAKQTHKPADQ